MTESLRFAPCGDRALLVYLGEGIDPAVNDRVHAATRLLRNGRHPAVVEITPSYHALMVEYDPVRIRMDQVEEMVRNAVAAADLSPATPRSVTLPVCYGDEMGPDLQTVADHARLTPAEVIARHTAPDYRVYCLGFSPGFPYMGGLDHALETPRLADPRTKVPGGSVGIGGNQTGIYPAPSPGGWRLIGRTPVQLFDPLIQPPTFFEPGDMVRFEAISAERFAELAAQVVPAQPELPAYAPGKTGLRILQPGLVTTTQDLGRRGYMAYGVTVAGAADFSALMVGNWLLGNRARTAGLEITLTGPEIEFTGPAAFALTGPPIAAELIPADGGSPRAVPGWTALLAGPGDRLRIGTAAVGCRNYLCIAGGIDLPPILGSLSEDLFGKIGPLGRPLQAGDWLPLGLPIHPPADLAGRHLPEDFIPAYADRATVRVVRGPHADAFAPEAFAAFFGSEYTVGAQSDRQGLRLEGARLAHAGRADILSEPIPPGGIQVPANGQPILLMGNRQTTGGYTQIGVAVYSDLAAASQLRPGNRITFKEVDLAEAHAIAWAERRRLGQMRRYLEREVGRQTEAVALPAAPAPSVTPPEPLAEPQPAPAPEAPQPVEANPPHARVFRVTIGDVEYEALVEPADE